MSNWTSSATTIMAGSIANSAKYVQSLSSTVTSNKNTPYASMTPSVIKACKEGENVKRHSTIPSLYGATSDSLDTYDAPYDPISRSIFMVDHHSASLTSERAKRMRRRFTTDVTDAESIVNQTEYPETTSKSIPNNGFKRMSDLFNFSSSASADKLK